MLGLGSQSKRVRRSLAVRVLIVMLVAVGLTACGGDNEVFDLGLATATDAADYAYVIPLGAGEALDRGEPLTVLPGELTVNVGEVIEIVNNDVRGHNVGPFFVGENETLRQKFASEGEYIGICTVHPSGELVVTVLP